MNQSSLIETVLPIQLRHVVSSQPALTIAIGFFLVLFIVFGYSQKGDGKQLPRLSEPIPYIYNTWQFLYDNYGFMQRAIKVLETTGITKFYLGGIPAYLLSGQENVKMFFGRSAKISTEKLFVDKVFASHYKLPPAIIKRFRDDKSGRGREPAPGSEHVSPESRYWARYNNIHTEYLSRAQNLEPMIEAFRDIFTKRLDTYELGKWESVGVVDFCRKDVTEAAISTLVGPGIFDTCPEFLDIFWDYDAHVFLLTLGLPRWLHSAPYKSQDRYLEVLGKHAAVALDQFDWNGPDAEAQWEPLLGARVCREECKLFREWGTPDVSIAGALGTLIFAQNSNATPTTMWCIMEICKDERFLEEIRNEVQKAWVTDPVTQNRVLDTQIIATLPLLQSIFAEVLRLHTNFNLIRYVQEPLHVQGYTLPVSSMVQLAMMTAHYDEAIWGSEGHPASEFWAERHIKHVEQEDEEGKIHNVRKFAAAGGPSSYFPFGGGVNVCPGRHFAKNEILCAIGLFVTKFDIEFEGWASLDGSRSLEQPPENDRRYCGVGSQPPDREMKLRIRRRS